MTIYPSPSPAGPPRLDQPHYGIGFGPAVVRGFRKYTAFSGRASRSEYWWWTLGVTLVEVVLAGLGLGLGLATSTDRGRTPGAGAWPFLILLVLFGLAVIVPTIAVTVRRLHDSGNSGWLYLLALIPYIGSVVIIVFGVLGTSPAGLKYESDPANAVLPPGMRPEGYLTPYGASSPYAASPPPYAAPAPYGGPPSSSEPPSYGAPPPYAAPPSSGLDPTWSPPAAPQDHRPPSAPPGGDSGR